MKDIKCPGEDLEILISNLVKFNHHCTLARIEPSTKEMRATIMQLFPNFDKKKLKRTEEIACNGIIETYVFNQRIAYTLSQYGDTKLSIRRNISGHLKTCEKCRKKYLLYLDEQTEKLLKWAKNEGLSDKLTKGYSQKILKRGYKNLLKDTDIFGFLD